MKRALAFFLLLTLATVSGSAQTEEQRDSMTLSLLGETVDALSDLNQSLYRALDGFGQALIPLLLEPEGQLLLDKFQPERLVRQKRPFVVVALKGDFLEETVRYRKHSFLGLFGPPVLKINGERLRLSREFVYNPEADDLHLITVHVVGDTYDVDYYLRDGAGGCIITN